MPRQKASPSFLIAILKKWRQKFPYQETFGTFAGLFLKKEGHRNENYQIMKDRFEVIFLEQASEFIRSLDDKTADKILYNIDKAKQSNDPELFKKLNGEIWEFRTLFAKKQYRLLAFWDKDDPIETLVVATHGLVKKTDKMPKKEIEKAEQIRERYFDEK